METHEVTANSSPKSALMPGAVRGNPEEGPI